MLFKMAVYTDEGTVKKEPSLANFAKNIDRETKTYQLKCKITDQIMGKDKNRVPDVMHVEFWVEASEKLNYKTTSSFVGEVYIPWKQAMLEGKRNEW